jgi:hypothetical protein
MTSTGAWIVGVVAAAVVAAIWMRSRATTSQTAQLADIPRLFEATAAGQKDGTFSGLLVTSVAPGADGNYANIQFSIDKGRIGLDWVLLAEINRKDQGRFEAIARSKGYVPELRQTNRVSYVRVEGGDLPAVCRDVLVELYGVSDASELGLILQNVKWP